MEEARRYAPSAGSRAVFPGKAGIFCAGPRQLHERPSESRETLISLRYRRLRHLGGQWAFEGNHGTVLEDDFDSYATGKTRPLSFGTGAVADYVCRGTVFRPRTLMRSQAYPDAYGAR